MPKPAVDLVELNRALLAEATAACDASRQLRYAAHVGRIKRALSLRRDPLWGSVTVAWASSLVRRDLRRGGGDRSFKQALNSAAVCERRTMDLAQSCSAFTRAAAARSRSAPY